MSGKTLVSVDAPGLPADWLNAWLAAIGVTVLLPEVKLSWTDDVVPYAVFWVPDGTNLPAALHRQLPSTADLAEMAIAPDGPGGKLGQKLNDLTLYRERAVYARRRKDTTFPSAYTDLAPEPDNEPSSAGRGQFNVGMEGKETLWRRLSKCLSALGDEPRQGADLIAASLGCCGASRRPSLSANGLGFDPRRLPSGADASDDWPAVDPVVEVLAFFGIQLMPVRGNGKMVLQKPWVRSASGSTSLVYGCWRAPLDSWAIDGVTDVMMGGPRSASSNLFHAWFRVVRYQTRGSEKKVAYFSASLG
jgi:hypothetical protein